MASARIATWILSAGLAACTAAAPNGSPSGAGDGDAVDAGQDGSIANDSGLNDTQTGGTDTGWDAARADGAQPDSATGDGGGDAGAVACQVPGKGAGTCMLTSACTGTATPGYCPGPKEIQCCTPTAASGACDPNAAPLPNLGLGAEPAGLGGCPAGMARIDPAGKPSYCIDRWEAALQVGATGAEFSPYHNPGGTAVRAVARPNQVPQGYISGNQAKAACSAAGKRLCSDGEWLRACQGPSGWTYPYGAKKVPKACNDSRAVHPAIELYGTSDAWIWSKLDNACLDQLPDSLANTGAFSACASAEGLMDMMGNLHEWTADPAGTFRGGYFVDTVINGPGCLYVTTAHDSSHWDYSTGFRCCADLP